MSHELSSSSVPSKTNTREAKIQELDEIIDGFAEAPVLLPREGSNGGDEIVGHLRSGGRRRKKEGEDSENDSSPPPSSSSVSDISNRFAPLHLKTQFEELYRVLHPALVDRVDRKNASAFLQGARGTGKSLVLELVLRSLLVEIRQRGQRPFRIVRLNGILVPGSQVTLCVQEILRQLTEMAYQEHNQHHITVPSPGKEEDEGDSLEGSNKKPRRKKRRKSERTRELLRLRKTCFTNQIQLLNEILQFACLDGIPILFILDELDTFVKSTGGESFSTGDTMDRQLLLYHLLDRVATDSSLVSFVGSTCHNGTLSLLEKRIRSRAEGTTRFIYFGPCTSWEDWVEIVSDKLKRHGNQLIHDEWNAIVTFRPNEMTGKERQQILDALGRSLNLGYSVRWLFRVLSSALMLYRHDLIRSSRTSESSVSEKAPSLQKCILQSLASNGAPFLTESGERDLIVIDKAAVNDRIQTLRDLSGPQLALVFAARRILVRDSHRENTVPLTLDRMLEEYKSYKGSSNRYSRDILWVSFRDLLATGLIRPGGDHNGTAPLQYNMDGSFLDLSAPTAGKLPLHLNLDIHRELQKAMTQKLLDCSTALQEWGKKTT